MEYIVVAGYGWSGSSAVVDLLKEYSSVAEPGVEFRLIKDPCGLIDLRRAVSEAWDALNSDAAIRNFLWLADHLAHAPKKMSLKGGLGYSVRLCPDFMERTRAFVDSITSFDYESSWWHLNWKRSKAETLARKVCGKLHLRRLVSVDRMRFSFCTTEEFDRATRGYLDGLFSEACSEGSRVLLDQAIPVQAPEVLPTYLGEGARMVIVDRDPRDIYVDLARGNNLIGRDLVRTHDPSKYVAWHRAWRSRREGAIDPDGLLRLRFEDIVSDYDTAVARVELFLGLASSDHVRPRTLFVPGASARNVGIWRDYPRQDEIDYVWRELGGDSLG